MTVTLPRAEAALARDVSLREQVDAQRRELVDEISRVAAEVALAPEARASTGVTCRVRDRR